MRFVEASRYSMLIVLLVTACGGCTGSDAPKTIPVSGTIRYRGEPLRKGDVTFMPVGLAEGAFSRPATAIIDSEGRYQLSSFAKGDGVMPGDYLIGIMSFKGEWTHESPESQIVWAIPKKFGDPNTSGLTATILAGQPEAVVLDLDLKD